MNCPYCNSELKYHDWYYRGNHAAYVNGSEGHGFIKLGDIYLCPNSDGYENLEEGLKVEFYGEHHEIISGTIAELIETPEKMIVKIESGGFYFILNDADIWTVPCDSSMFNGKFYTDLQDNLHEGNP